MKTTKEQDMPAKMTTTGRFCIVRCMGAGVHAGTVVSRQRGVLILKNSRRLWKWWSKATLSELAMEGPINIAENKYGCVLPVLELTASDICEVIPCTRAAKQAIESVPEWTAS
jgi:hypothetical protein